MVVLFFITALLQTLGMCASMQSSLVALDKNLRTLNAKISIDEKQALIKLLLESGKQVTELTSTLFSTIFANKAPLDRATIIQLADYWAVFIRANVTASERSSIYTNGLLKELNTFFAITKEDQTEFYKKFNLILHDPTSLTKEDRHCLRFAFFVLTNAHYHNINNEFTSGLATAVMPSELTTNLIDLLELSFKNQTQETLELLEFMKTSGNDELETLYTKMNELWKMVSKT